MSEHQVQRLTPTRDAFYTLTEIIAAAGLSALTAYGITIVTFSPCIAGAGQVLVTAAAITLIARYGFGQRASFAIALMGASFGLLAVFFTSPLFFQDMNLVVLWVTSSIVPAIVAVIGIKSQPHIRRGI